jgi:hypothetical protein
MRIVFACFAILIANSLSSWAGANEPIQFARDIRPLLSDRCFSCHGPEEKSREAGLRFDVEEVAKGELESGATAVVPGAVEKSELIARITSTDPDVQMPPADSGKTLKPDEIARLKQWIAEGAPWQGHWAFNPPARPQPPAVKLNDWASNTIDLFILARLESEGLSPTAEADQVTLVRRVTFDLTGLPPTPAEVDAFLADTAPGAYERLVDRLLASPRFGEHRARFWLDAARYGDTHGLHLDNYREMWLYRDWVVNAFNDNFPFSQFIVEQLAGDLLPEPTTDQMVATGFNRCHVTTSEGGSIEEEVYVRNVVDRVTTTGTVFMGLTLECTRCHDHKYDPLTMKDFYSMFAFFNNIDGGALDGNKKDPAPVLRVATPEQEQQIETLRKQLAADRATIVAKLDSFEYVEPAKPKVVQPVEPREVVWIDDALPPGVKAEGGWQFVSAPAPVHGGEKASTRNATGLSQHYFTGATPPLVVSEGDVLFAHVFLDADNPPKQIMLQWNDGSWEHRVYWGGDHIPWGTNDSPSRLHMGPLPKAGEWVRLEVPVHKVGLGPGAEINGWAFTQFDGLVYWDTAGIVTTGQQKAGYDSLLIWQRDESTKAKSTLPGEIRTVLKLESDRRSDAQQKTLRNYFIEHVYTGSRDDFTPLHEQIRKAEEQIKKLEAASPTALVFRERKDPRPAFMLKRGEYDQRGDPVERATPGFLPSLSEDLPRNRLGLAQWLIDPQHPLTARVTVNRFWLQMFGTGLVKTAEDFGSQGEPPSHPALLDWLAVQFVADGWDVKKTIKRMVMSSTYRQSSRVTPELIRRDPENRLLARGPRFRLDAEMLRDQALAVSGLLIDKLGGPSVKPPQPDGLWFAVGYSGSNTVRFQADTGREKVHRRTLYTFIKRTAPPPQMSTLDGPSRESCIVRRERTNTPLQALLLMNDPQFVEAARVLGQRAFAAGGDALDDRLEHLFRLATLRAPDADELELLREDYQGHLEEFTQNPAEAAKLIQVGEVKPTDAMRAVELAAWTMTANLVLNMDEVVSKN